MAAPLVSLDQAWVDFLYLGEDSHPNVEQSYANWLYKNGIDTKSDSFDNGLNVWMGFEDPATFPAASLSARMSVSAEASGADFSRFFPSGYYRRGTGNVGDFFSLQVPMQRRMVKAAARDGGIDISGVKFSIDRSADLIGRNLFGHTNPLNGHVTIFPDAFRDYETLIATVGHERQHVMQLDLYGYVEPTDSAVSNAFEQAAWDSEPDFVNYYRMGGAPYNG